MTDSADTMKHIPGSGCPDTEACGVCCSVKCSCCRYEKERYPARFRWKELKKNDALKEMDRRAHHIVFLLEGALHVHCKTKENYSLVAGQCLLLSRDSAPELTASEPSRIVWLDFSNRIVFGCQDYLSQLSVSDQIACSPPMLTIDPLLGEIIERILFICSPCYHLLKEHELFMVMCLRYNQEELAVFFRSILRPIHDLRAFVLSNYREAQGVEDFARKANLSESTFVRRFREVFGVTVHQWLMKQREKDLCRMIAAGERDVKKLAQGIGLAGSTGLYQFCRKRFGCPITALLSRYSNESQ